MVAGIATRNAVIAVRVPQGLEVLGCLNQRLSIFEGILRMHIVICQSVTDKQRTMLLLYSLDRIHLVTLFVLLRSTHVALCINRIIEAVAGRRSHSHTCLEHRTALAHTHQRIETTIAPTPNADIILVYIRQRTHVESCFNLIFRL